MQSMAQMQIKIFPFIAINIVFIANEVNFIAKTSIETRDIYNLYYNCYQNREQTKRDNLNQAIPFCYLGRIYRNVLVYSA